MGDSNSRKSGPVPRQGGISPSAPGQSTGEKSVAPKDAFAGKSGRIVHDERGNAVWDWIKETSRIAIDSTSRLLKRLEVPELKVEDTQKNDELGLESDRDAGGGYNPYGGSTSGGRAAPGRRVSGSGPGGAASRGRPNSNAGGSNVGGGYDPYGKGVTRKSGR